MKRLEQKIQNHRSIVSLKDNKVLLQRELMWAKVRDVEEELKQEDSKVKVIEKKLNEFRQNAEKRNEKIATLQEKNRYINF